MRWQQDMKICVRKYLALRAKSKNDTFDQQSMVKMLLLLFHHQEKDINDLLLGQIWH